VSDNLTTALAKFHKAVGTIHKNSRAQYGNFASLADVLSAIASPLSESGLAVTQTFIPTEGATILRTTLRHSSGETIDSDVPLIEVKGRNALHDWGGAVTFQRRFSLLAILSLAAGMEDDDGDSADDKPAKPAAKPAPARTVKPSPTPAPAAPQPPKQDGESSVEPPLVKDERDEILAVLGSLKSSNPTAFAQFESDFREAFNLTGAAKIAPAIQEKRHGDWIQNFLASLPEA
jgi:hypothetical protein